jgi:hypothetical protein
MSGFLSRAFFAIKKLPHYLLSSERVIASRMIGDTLSRLKAWFYFDVASAPAKPARKGKRQSGPAQAQSAEPLKKMKRRGAEVGESLKPLMRKPCRST